MKIPPFPNTVPRSRGFHRLPLVLTLAAGLAGITLLAACKEAETPAGDPAAGMSRAEKEIAAWELHEFHGLKLALPTKPVPGEDVAAGLREGAIGEPDIKYHELEGDGFKLSLMRIELPEGEIDLEGMRQGGAENFLGLPTVSDARQTPGKRTVGGKEALTMEIRCKMAGHEVFVGQLSLGGGSTAWQVTVIGKPPEAGIAWERVLESCKLPEAGEDRKGEE